MVVGEGCGLVADGIDDDQSPVGVVADRLEDRAGPLEAVRLPGVLAEHRRLEAHRGGVGERLLPAHLAAVAVGLLGHL